MKPHPTNLKNFKCASIPTLSVRQPIPGLAEEFQ